MRSPAAARALPGLVRDGVLAESQAAPLLAAARGEVVTVRAELRALAGLAVALITGGVGLYVKENLDAIGPGAIALALGVAAAGTLLLAARRAASFSWGESPGADWLLDGLLVLGIGLLGADLAWIEVRFAALGEAWPWHLLLMSLITGALAVRFDSKVVWSLALSTFAAWRGVSVLPWGDDALESAALGDDDTLRWNLLLCGLVFALLGRAAERFGLKPHFEPATSFLAALAAGLGFASGLGVGSVWPLWALGLAALGALVARWAFGRRRLGLFALGALAIYVAATRFLLEVPFVGGLGCFWFAATSIGAIVLLVTVHRRFRAGEAS
jgi:hypothetical protein